ncbi:MAG TPA: hypothetical protein VE964_12795 [Myxococcales bacterium]|nr:hypothetical protein [Myxococcales bacterium]
MELGVGEQRIARGGGRRKRAVEHVPRRMQEIRSRASEPLGMKPVGHQLDKKLRREGRR